MLTQIRATGLVGLVFLFGKNTLNDCMAFWYHGFDTTEEQNATALSTTSVAIPLPTNLTSEGSKCVKFACVASAKGLNLTTSLVNPIELADLTMIMILDNPTEVGASPLTTVLLYNGLSIPEKFVFKIS